MLTRSTPFRVPRNMTKGQRAMTLAMIYPEPEKGGARERGSISETKTELMRAKISDARLSQARTVLRHSRELAQAVVAGITPLDLALAEVQAVNRIGTSPGSFANASGFVRVESVNASNEHAPALRAFELRRRSVQVLMICGDAEPHVAACGTGGLRAALGALQPRLDATDCSPAISTRVGTHLFAHLAPYRDRGSS
jgi:hypothetical protein